MRARARASPVCVCVCVCVCDRASERKREILRMCVCVGWVGEGGYEWVFLVVCVRVCVAVSFGQSIMTSLCFEGVEELHFVALRYDVIKMTSLCFQGVGTSNFCAGCGRRRVTVVPTHGSCYVSVSDPAAPASDVTD